MEETPKYSNLFTEAKLEKLLNRGHYGIIDNQLLFFNEEQAQYVLTQISEEENYTVSDYLQLPESAPYELLNGKLIFMAAPHDLHQKLLGNLYFEIRSHTKANNLGEVRFAPYDVQFDENNMVQPDLLFVSIARKSIIDKFIKGSPDFIVEINSPSSQKRDNEIKLKLYDDYDVIEYWIIKPAEQTVEVYHNHNHQMLLQQEATTKDSITSKAITGLVLPVATIFE